MKISHRKLSNRQSVRSSRNLKAATNTANIAAKPSMCKATYRSNKRITSSTDEDEEFNEVYSELLNVLNAEGYDVNTSEVTSYAYAAADYIVNMAGPGYTVRQWLKDTKMNYPEDLDELPMIESCSIVSSKQLSEKQLDALDEISERYSASAPISGDWNTETQHEQKAISDELHISMSDAKDIMISQLGFQQCDFK